MYLEIIEKVKPELEKAIDYLKRELAKVRTSRPSISLIEEIEVDIFGKKFPLKSLGLITLSESQEIVIQPWDASYLQGIEKAISQSPLQLSLIVEKERIRIRFPPLTEATRKNLVKILSQKAEDVRRSVRHWRGKAWREIQDKFLEGEISEDEKYRAKDKLQELVDEYNEKIEEMIERKKKEIIE